MELVENVVEGEPVRLIMDRLFELVDEGEQRAVVIVDLVDSERIGLQRVGRCRWGGARVSGCGIGRLLPSVGERGEGEGSAFVPPNASTSQGIVSFRVFRVSTAG